MKPRKIRDRSTPPNLLILAGIVCIITAFFVLFFQSLLVYAGTSDSKVLKSVTLAGSRQGQSIGVVDVDGDGIDDKIVGAPYASSSYGTGAVLGYLGDPGGGFSSSPSMLLTGDDNYGFSFVNLGDIDGDSREDFAVGAFNGSGTDVSLSGSVTIYKGGKSSNYDKGRGKIIAKLSGEGPMDKFGISLSAGDLNGDNLKDLIVGAPFNTPSPAIYQGGTVYIFFAPDFTSKIVLHASPSNRGLGLCTTTGDINGDDIADLCISASGKVLCYYGRQDFSPSTDVPDIVVKSSSSGFGKSIAITGDLNADQFGEIIIGSPNAVVNGNRDTGCLYIVKGGTGERTIDLNAASSDLIVRIDGTALFNRFGASLSSVDDIDGDQISDFAVGAPMADVDEFQQLVGKVHLFKGADISAGTTLSDSIVFEGSARDQGYGTSIAACGSRGLLIGAPRADNDDGSVFMVDLASGQVQE